MDSAGGFLEKGADEPARIGRPPKKWRYVAVSYVMMSELAKYLSEESEHNGFEFVAAISHGSRILGLVRKEVR